MPAGMNDILATFVQSLAEFLRGIPGFLVAYSPVLVLVLFGAIVWIMFKMMPKTQTQVQSPESASAVGWKDVAGVDEFRKELEEVVEFIRDPARFRALGAKVPKGVMLYGPPGTGKTLLAKAVAGESGAMFYAQSASGFVEMFAGLGAARIRRLFAEARKNSPAIIFIDEMDAIGGARTGGGDGGSREKDQTLNQLLVELDGFGGEDQVVIIGATNRLETLDPALLRAGRFDRSIYVGPPDVKGRHEILLVHTKGKPLADDLDLAMVARRTPGATGADLANICNEAAIYAGRAGRTEIIQKDFEAAFERVVTGIAQAKVMTVEERTTVAYHEAGHAILSSFVEPRRPVHRITIVPTGQALGYVLHVPEEDKYTESREELINQMIVALGGRAAEELKFGRIWNGASSDLEKVSAISRAMVFDWGMGKTVNSLALKADNYSLSERTKELRDMEQRELADHAYDRARSMLAEREDLLEKLALVLLEKETLDQTEVEEILGLTRLSPTPLTSDPPKGEVAAFNVVPEPEA
ncbi:MAG: ATP-dependent metallopeptidase FtsH/Yme1/Tma family protein [Thermoleophilia bacterium]|nr:ATP-dependent metallopeptidase FtsH/Yme1/Tma family protein [Thermoleophilia bacterium]